MDRISIVGGKPLNGSLPISGAKNAALPLMIASLLTHDRLTLKNVPNLADVNTLARILRNHGVDLAVDGKRADPSPYLGETFHLTARDIVDTTAPYEMVNRMRASFWVLGPLLARCGEARVSMPGGCAIGTRPVDLHLMGLKALGAEIDIDGGDVELRGARKSLLETAFAALEKTGVSVSETATGVRVARNGGALEPITIETQPFPGFPTDLQAQLMALMTKAAGTSVIRETIFENRFMHVQELARLGADIQLQGDTAIIKGVKSLRGAQVMATDLRASVSLVIGGLMAEGKTTINRVYHLDLGFERLEQKLSGCGADIERLVSG